MDRRPPVTAIAFSTTKIFGLFNGGFLSLNESFYKGFGSGDESLKLARKALGIYIDRIVRLSDFGQWSAFGIVVCGDGLSVNAAWRFQGLWVTVI